MLLHRKLGELKKIITSENAKVQRTEMKTYCQLVMLRLAKENLIRQ
jgi:hypothetical protein